LTHVLSTLAAEDFLALLPDVRLAFSAFTPTQIDRVGRRVAEHLGAGERALREKGTPEAIYALGLALDEYYTQVKSR
jgi:hypothetical protein